MIQLNATTYKEVAKSDPKDRISVIIGDDKQADFFPQVKLERWDETNFSVRLKDDDGKNAQISTLQDKIIWDKGNTKIEFYPDTEGEGGYKFVWFLKSKPVSNKVEFSIQSKSLDFFYQPPLTQEYQNGYSEEFQREIVVSETQVKDLDGNVLVERPENVVNSYAVYHSTKGGMNDINGKDYKVGKAFHIYRPHLIDANGLEAWGILKIENGIYSVEIPQDFLENAVYPIKSNDTFGYTGAGGSYNNLSTDEIYMRKGIPGSTGVVDNIRASMALTNAGSTNYQHGLYNSDLSLVSPQTATGVINSTTKQWWILDFSGGPTVTGSNTYYVATFVDGLGTGNYIKFYKDTGGVSGDSKYVDGTTYNSWPNPPTAGNSTSIYSIYATYTPSGGGTTYNAPMFGANF
jgi:hypothetical protein